MSSTETNKNTAGQFRSNVWDPCLLVAEIAAMQCIFYGSLSVIIGSMDQFFGTSPSLDQIFKYQSMYARSLGGSKLFVAFLLNAPICALGLWYIVRRAKQCLDFATTVHLIHFLISCIYNGAFPTYISWWLLHIICVTVTTVMGEYLCLQTEMKAIPVSVGIKSDV